MAELAVEVTGLVYRRGKTPVLSGVGIRVERGSLYALVGPRGAGKSTILRALTGLVRAVSGEVSVLGRTVPDRRLRSRVGYVPQEVGLYPDLTVRENLALFAELQGLAAPEIGIREAELLELLGLVEWRLLPLFRVPEPVRRRVSLAAALIHHPELLILDEPVASADPELRSAFWALTAKLRSSGVTTLMATTEFGEAERCDRAAFLRGGVVLAEGAPEDIRRRAGTATLEEAYLALSRKGEGS